MIYPTIHGNGTNPEDLLADAEAAFGAISDAMDALRRMAPNGRDYYPQDGNAIGTAQDEHWERHSKLRGVKDELEELMRHIVDHPYSKGRL